MFRKSLFLLIILSLILPGTALAKKRSRASKITLDEITSGDIARAIDTGMRSGNMKVRGNAYMALSLSSRNKKEIEAGLKDGLKDPQNLVVAGVVHGMILRGLKGYDEAFIKVLGAPDLDWNTSVAPIIDALPQKRVSSLLISALNAKGLRGKNRIAAQALSMDTKFSLAFIAAAQKAGGEAATKTLATLADLSPTLAQDLYPAVVRSGSDAAKAVVLSQIGKLPKDLDRTFLTPLLKSKDSGVRNATALILAPVGNRSAAQILVPMAMDSTASEAQRLQALQAIQGAADKSMLIALEPLLDPTESVSNEMKGAAYGCHARAGDVGVLALVNADLLGTDGGARAAASRWLGTLGGAKEIPRLKELLVDGSAKVRQNAAFSLGELRTLDVIPILEQGLRDISPEVKLEAVRALAKVRNNQVAEIVQYLMFDKDIEIRKETIQILGEARHVATISTLENALSDTDMDLRFAALLAIMKTDLERGKKAFKRSLLWLQPAQLIELARQSKKEFVSFAALALDHRRPEIRQAGLDSLGMLSPAIANPMLASFKESSRHENVRRAAYLAAAAQNWQTELPIFTGWLLSVETTPADLELAFTALERAPASQAVFDALKAGFVINEDFQVRAALAMLKLLKGK